MKLTKNFSLHEFDCKDGSSMPDGVLVNIKKLSENLQVIRNYIGLPIIVNSAYRTPSHNKKVGGSPKSQHLYGKASDIRVNGMTCEQLREIIFQLIEQGKILDGGVGIYNNFVHYDIRGIKARWDFRK